MNCPTQTAKFERLYADVFTILCTGEYRPGDRIGIKDLSGRLAVSTTPLREVLSRLAGRGVVDERRSEGFYLARLDARDVADLYALHCTCVMRGLRQQRECGIDTHDVESAWALFARIAETSGDIAIIEARALIDDRLRIVRRIEDYLVPERDVEFARLIDQLSSQTHRETATTIRRFHDRRRAMASEFAAALTRPPSSRNISKI